MIVVHIESGLGNQMLSYCEFLALKKVNPNNKIYIETIIYEIPEACEYINQWNGYELNKVFNIDAPNIKTLFSEDEWNEILNEIKETEFWKKNWNYPVYFTEIFSKHGLELKNIRGDFENNYHTVITSKTKFSLKMKIKNTGIYSNLKRLYNKLFKKKYTKSDNDKLFYKTEESIFTGQRLSFKFNNNNIELIEHEIKESFIFPQLDQKNELLKQKLITTNSVAIHVRRGDMIFSTNKYYRSNYFKRAVKLIKKKVKNPTFVFFSDPNSCDWCKKNLNTFGLDIEKDQIMFVDWNDGDNSYKDMQLMSYCKHNIITGSTFGWWGTYLNNNPDKITISPEIDINTNYHC